MELEEFRAAWRKEAREEYLRNPFTTEIAAKIAAEAKRLERQQLLRDSLSGGLFLVTAVAYIGIIAVETSTAVRAGAALALAGLVGEYLYTARTAWLERNKPLDLPLKLALTEERKRILAEVRRLQVRLVLYAVPLVGGIVLLPFARKNITGFLIGFIIAGCACVVGGLAIRLLQAGKKSKPVLQGIDEYLAEIAEMESDPEGFDIRDPK
jgi:hypothetical protein